MAIEKPPTIARPAADAPDGGHELDCQIITARIPAERRPCMFPDSRSAEEAARLQGSLAGLAQLSIDRFDLEGLLNQVASYGLQAIPGADEGSLTLLGEHGQHAIGATSSLASDTDHLQHQIGQGPCITALSDQYTVSSGCLGGDPRWPRFGGAAARRGLHSAMSLPLITNNVVGVLTVYAHSKHAFDSRAAKFGESFAVPGAFAVQNGQVLDRALHLVAGLQTAVATKATIERAVGIMMSRSGITDHEALNRLRTLSQHQHAKLPVVAQQIIDQSVRRARSRPRPT